MKISRGDFFSDAKKPHRAKGMGCWRFYCVPKGLIKKEELPEKWGLIYVDENGKARMEYDCRKKEIPCEPITFPAGFGEPERMITKHITTADENRFEPDMVAERRIMYSALRRLFIKGHMESIYDKDYQRLSPVEILAQYEDVNELKQPA